MEYIPTYLLTVVLIAVLYFSYRDREDAKEERAELLRSYADRERSLLDRIMAKNFEEFKDNETSLESSFTSVNDEEETEEAELDDVREELENG